jgi:hypothetical protein
MMPPEITMHAMAASRFMKHFGILLLPIFVAIFWTDARICRKLYNRYGKGIAIAWARVVAVTILGYTVYVMFGAVLPLWKYWLRQ